MTVPKSAIDLGTNTVLMVTGRRRAGGDGVEILDDAHAIARLGQGVDDTRRILPEAIDRVCAILDTYRQRAVADSVTDIRAYGTSALRDAANKAEFVSLIKERTGIELVELSGEAEARHTFIGAAFDIDLPRRYAVLDIGGGSTELALGSAGRVEQAASVNVGAVRVTERCFGADLPPGSVEREAAVEMARREFSGLFQLPEVPLVGVAGTVTTLGAIDTAATRFDADSLNGHFLSRARVEELASHLLDLTYDEIRAIPQVNEQRADIIAAGALILQVFLEAYDMPGVIVSTRGIRYGLLLEMLEAA